NLHKLVQREFTTITGESGDMDVDTPAPTEAKAADATSSSKAPKTRPPALGKLLKTRLQKLYKMTDDEGRQLCGVFMDPPSRRAYPTYYQIIKKVMTFNMIEKKIDRKEYENAEQFMEDVELIWSNAYTFNEEHSPVWEGAKVLQASEAFRNLVSDLPAPYTLPPFEDSKAHAPPTKIKLKVKDHRARSTDSGAAASSSPTQEQAKPASPPQADPPAVTLTALPATITHRGSGTPGPAPSPAVPTPPIAPTGTSTPGPTYPPAGTPYGTTSQMPTQYPGYPYYPNAYQQPFAPYQAPTPAAQTPAPQIAQPAPTTTTAASQPTAPVASAKKPPHVKHIRALTIKTTPAGRRMRFENVEGLNLRMWSMRLGGGENGVELVDLEVYEKPIVPKQLKKAVVKKGKGKGKSDDSMDVDEGEDDEEGSGDDEAPNKSADGEIDVPVEVKLNNFPVTSSPAPVLSTPDTAPIASPIASPNGTMLNGNGHSVDAQSDSELTDPDDAPKTRSSGKSKGKAGARNSKTRKVSKSGSKGGLKAGSDSNSVKTRVEPRIWVAGLKEGQNTLDVKVGSEQSETWRIFVDRVV
ncbi:Methionine aminopeptidase 2, partial [Tulasnella sp. 427]